MKAATHRFFATTFNGLEDVLAGEIAALGAEEIYSDTESVSFSGTMELCQRANLWLRSANRISLLLAEFKSPTPADLYEGVRKIPWTELFSPERTISVDVTVRESEINNSHLAAQQTKDAIVDRFFRNTPGRRPNMDTASSDIRIVVRIVRDFASIYIDTSGESLHRRGYRTHPAEASLKETLAAGLILLTGWQGQKPLIDPVCGSGTIPIEAALIAGKIAPGSLGRTFGFQKIYCFNRKAWERILSEAHETAREASQQAKGVRIEGSDISPEAISGAVRNASNAKVKERIGLSIKPLQDFSPGEGPGTILCNPPYSARMTESEQTEMFYRELGKALKKRCSGWTAYLLSGNLHMTRFLDLKSSRKFPVKNGPIDCKLLKYNLYS